ncbi:hypothetical protein HXX76_007353 [Chlamydomonas incerta]|uniref:Uncharacterized protein n=1 Tax=Chlamydomonas incerta TaxID=51695 RepID=A0A835TBR9_CHLIN|nr:hypothetical protein HXX76_007353 [Chlamydomonas incerta]|eukprot:KAG2435276.1 hypothetical protein HXX76_007353 [Chlamydomonas incerta]
MHSQFAVARKLQAACAVARSFLGPGKALKCVVDESSESRNVLAGTIQAYLLAADGDPTATTLLLEALESQTGDPGATAAAAPGSGTTWLAAVCGLLLGGLLEAVEGQGVPYEAARQGLLAAVAECCQIIRSCAVEIPVLVGELRAGGEERAGQDQEAAAACGAGSSSAPSVPGAGGVGWPYMAAVAARVHPPASWGQQQQRGSPRPRYPRQQQRRPHGGGVHAPGIMHTAAADGTVGHGWGGLPQLAGVHGAGKAPPPPAAPAGADLDAFAAEGALRGAGNSTRDAAAGAARTALAGGSGATAAGGGAGGVAVAAVGGAAGEGAGLGWDDDWGPAAAEVGPRPAQAMNLHGQPQLRIGQPLAQAPEQPQAQQQPSGVRLQPYGARPHAAPAPAATLRSSARQAPAGRPQVPLEPQGPQTEDDEFGWFDSFLAAPAGEAAVGCAGGVGAEPRAQVPAVEPAPQQPGQQPVFGSLLAESSSSSNSSSSGSSSSRSSSSEDDTEGGRGGARRRSEEEPDPALAALLRLAAHAGRRHAPDAAAPADAAHHHGNGRRGFEARHGGEGDGDDLDDDDFGNEGGDSDGEARLQAMEEEVSWFFGAGELEAARAARVERRSLAAVQRGAFGPMAAASRDADARERGRGPGAGAQEAARDVRGRAGSDQVFPSIAAAGFGTSALAAGGPATAAAAARLLQPHLLQPRAGPERQSLRRPRRDPALSPVPGPGPGSDDEFDVWPSPPEAAPRPELQLAAAQGPPAIDGLSAAAAAVAAVAAVATAAGAVAARESALDPSPDGAAATAPVGCTPAPAASPLTCGPAQAVQLAYHAPHGHHHHEQEQVVEEQMAAPGEEQGVEEQGEEESALQVELLAAQLVCTAAAGLAHGRPREMRLAAAAVLVLLQPLLRRHHCQQQQQQQQQPSLAQVAGWVQAAASGLSYERCVLPVELAGRWRAAAAAPLAGAASMADGEEQGDAAEPSGWDEGGLGGGADGLVVRGVCVPLASLSAAQAALVTSFLDSLRAESAAAESAAAAAAVATAAAAPLPGGGAGGASSSGGGGSSSGSTDGPPLAPLTAVFFLGSLQPEPPPAGGAGAHVTTLRPGAATPLTAAAAATAVAASTSQPAPPGDGGEHGREAGGSDGSFLHLREAQGDADPDVAFAARLLLRLAPLGVQLLLASGHVPDRVAAAVQQLSGGRVLVLGGAGVRAVRAAAACAAAAAAATAVARGAAARGTGAAGAAAAVRPSGVPVSSLQLLVPGRNVVPGMRPALLEGGLGLGDYRAGAGRGAAAVAAGDGGGGGGGGGGHLAPGLLLQLVMEGGAPGAAVAGRPAAAPATAAAAAAAPAAAGPAPLAVAAAAQPGAGWVTVLLAHPLTMQLEASAAAFKVCFCRLVAALRGGRLLPGGGAWEAAAAEQLELRAQALERDVARAQERRQEDRQAVRQEKGRARKEPAAQEQPLSIGSSGKAVATRAGGASEPGDRVQREDEEEVEEEEEDGADEPGLYLPLCYRLLADALRDAVRCLLQNSGGGGGGGSGSGPGAATALVATCGRALRCGDIGALRRLALPEPEAVLGGGGGGTGARPGGPGGGCWGLDGDDGGEWRQLPASLLRLMALWTGGAGGEGSVNGRRGGMGASCGGGLPGAVWDELVAREIGLKSACRLALLASCVDSVIVNR